MYYESLEFTNMVKEVTVANLSLDEALSRTEEIAWEVLAPVADITDSKSLWPEAGIRALQDAGLGGLVVAKQHGGHGHGLYAMARVCESLGTTCASTAMCFGMHCVASAVISAKATKYHEQKYLDDINKGNHLSTLSLSEAGTGAHFYLPQTQLHNENEEFFRLSGEKTFVTNGSHADSYVMSTTGVSGDDTPGQFSCVVVNGDNPALKWGPEWQGFGMRGNSSRSVQIENARIPREALLGNEGDQMWYVFQVIAPYFLTAMSGVYLGIATSALSAAREHLVRRRHTTSGSTLARQPVLQHRFATLWAEVERTRQLLYFAAQEGDKPGNEAAIPYLLSAKAEVAECAVHVTNEAMTLMGGIAYREGAVLQRNLRDARAAHVMAPTTDILRTWTGRALLGLPLLGD